MVLAKLPGKDQMKQVSFNLLLISSVSFLTCTPELYFKKFPSYSIYMRIS